MDAIVTGGAGFIGSHLVDELLANGGKIRVFDNLTTGCEENINDAVEFIHGDIRNNNLLESCLEGIDCVIHLAAVTGPLCDKAPKATIQTNEVATKELVNLCKKKKIKRFFFASSC